MQAPSGWNVFAQVDRVRSRLGRQLEAAGFGPQETPSRVAHAEPGLSLLAYEPRRDDGPVVLVVPAPIKQAYIWDLRPEVSAVRRLVEAGCRVYLIRWERPPSPDLGLDAYADRLIRACARAVEDETGSSRVVLAGHSLGGTQAAVYAALHPSAVKALVLLESPLRFGPAVSAFGPLVAAAPPAEAFTSMLGDVPGSWLNVASVLAAPDEFLLARWIDLGRSLPDADARQTLLRVERWALDEMPLARRFFEEVVEDLYRGDRLVQGTLSVGAARAVPAAITAPLLSVVDPRSRVVPPEAVLPFHAATRSTEEQVLRYEGDVGVSLQHVGVLVGEQAHRRLWPQITEWIGRHG